MVFVISNAILLSVDLMEATVTTSFIAQMAVRSGKSEMGFVQRGVSMTSVIGITAIVISLLVLRIVCSSGCEMGNVKVIAIIMIAHEIAVIAMGLSAQRVAI